MIRSQESLNRFHAIKELLNVATTSGCLNVKVLVSEMVKELDLPKNAVIGEGV